MNPWILIAVFVLGNALGGSYVSAKKTAAIAQLEADTAKAAKTTADAARDRLQKAVERGDALTIRLAQAEDLRQTQARETQREIKRLTTGRPCLDAGAVRLLNDAASRQPGAVPAPAGGAAAADAAFATDTDVGLWADAARRQYDQCRDRIQALNDYYLEDKQ